MPPVRIRAPPARGLTQDVRFGLVKQVETVRPESVSGQRQERFAVRLRVERNVAI